MNVDMNHQNGWENVQHVMNGIVFMKKKLYWEDPLIIKENKEDGHVLALCYDKADKAAKRQESPYKISLNGTWKFYWSKGVGELPEEFKAADYDDSGKKFTQFINGNAIKNLLTQSLGGPMQAAQVTSTLIS